MAIQFAQAKSVVHAVVKPESKPVKLNAKQWCERDPEAYRAYMREYMKKRRARS